MSEGSKENNESYKIRVSGRRCVKDCDVVRCWAIAGKGVVFKSRLNMTGELRADQLAKYHASRFAVA